jgi:hypothetical protein
MQSDVVLLLPDWSKCNCHGFYFLQEFIVSFHSLVMNLNRRCIPLPREITLIVIIQNVWYEVDLCIREREGSFNTCTAPVYSFDLFLSRWCVVRLFRECSVRVFGCITGRTVTCHKTGPFTVLPA